MEILGLDIGSQRIGVARVNSKARLPEALEIIGNDSNSYRKIEILVKELNIDKIVIGLPRNMSGQETAQTEEAKRWLEQAPENYLNDIEVIYSDETLSSVNARELYPDAKYVDHYAAAIILEMYLNNQAKRTAEA